jgi:transposase
VVACRRLAAGRRQQPTAAIIDTQSVRTGPQGGPRGYDAHRKIKGTKRVLLADRQGDLLGVRIVPADVQDRDALRSLAPDLDRHASLLLVWLDRAFAGQLPQAFLERHGITSEIVGTPGRKGFQIEPRRWKIEQTFGALVGFRGGRTWGAERQGERLKVGPPASAGAAHVLAASGEPVVADR